MRIETSGDSRKTGEKKRATLMNAVNEEGEGVALTRSAGRPWGRGGWPVIGSSRETVTLLLSEFKKKQFLQIINYTFIITSKAGLENALGS
jgi:hypothetical protein